MLSRFVLFTATTLCLLAQSDSSRAVGVVRGIVRDPGRAPLPSVTLVLGPDFTSKLPGMHTAYAISGIDGRFEIKNVPPGNYVVCPQVANSDILDPCIWTSKPPTVTIGGGGAAATAELDLAVARGTYLYVRVDDPSGVMANEPSEIAVGARSSAGFRQGSFAPIVGPGGDRIYRIAVPLNQSYTPTINTGKFQVEFGAPGERLASPFEKVTESRLGEAPKILRVTVKGLAGRVGRL